MRESIALVVLDQVSVRLQKECFFHYELEYTEVVFGLVSRNLKRDEIDIRSKLFALHSRGHIILRVDSVEQCIPRLFDQFLRGQRIHAFSHFDR